jgi:signal transduction histidine kinase
MFEIILISVAVLALAGALIIYGRSQRWKKELGAKEKAMNRRMYELAILKELGERVGYSLNVQNIVDIIIGSLHQLIEYSVVSYMLLEPEKVIFKVHLEESVSRHFIDEVCDRMLKSLSALLDKEIAKGEVEEVLSGAIIVEEMNAPVNSYFNIPIVIDKKVVGILTVAHTQQGLYKEEEMTILYKITQQASQAVTRLQDVVKTEQGKLNAMVETMNEGVAMVDKDYRVMVVNPAAKKMLGLSGQNEITIFDFIDHLGGVFDIRGKLEESIKLDKVIVVDEVLINDRFLQIFVSPVKANAGVIRGQIMGGVTIFRDITQEKEVERLREDFTSMLVHELRSPLDGIKKMAGVIKEHKMENDVATITEFLPMIYDSSSRMLELVNDLLDSAKMEAGKFKIYKEDSDLKKVIAERLAFYEVSAGDKKVILEKQIDSKLPEKISCDAPRIGQVLNNLLANAINFTSAGGKVVLQAMLHQKGAEVATEAKQAGIKWFINGDRTDLNELQDSVIIGITDSGIGISQENIKQLFNKFKQFIATSKQAASNHGTGLGLAISKGIVESHNGLIGAASEEGVGTTFYFSLPLQTEAVEKSA